MHRPEFTEFTETITTTFLPQSAASACTCHDHEVAPRPEAAAHMKVVLSPSGQPVIITHFDQKLRDLRTLKQVRRTYQRSVTHRRVLRSITTPRVAGAGAWPWPPSSSTSWHTASR